MSSKRPRSEQCHADAVAEDTASGVSCSNKGAVDSFYKVQLEQLALAHSHLLRVIGGENVTSGKVAAARSWSNLSSTSNEENSTTNESSSFSSTGIIPSSVPFGIFRSQVKQFSQMIASCPDVLPNMPELAPWLEPNVSRSGSIITEQICGGNKNKEKGRRDEAKILPKTEADGPRQAHVRVGVGVIVKDPMNPEKIFAGRRKGSHGAGTIALPGGHLEMFETWQECAIREVREEMGVVIHNVHFAHITNDPMPSEGKHYITIFMTAELKDFSATPTNCEPHKCEGWDSYSLEDLKKMNTIGGAVAGLRLFGPLSHLVQEKPRLLVDFLEP